MNAVARLVALAVIFSALVIAMALVKYDGEKRFFLLLLLPVSAGLIVEFIRSYKRKD